MSAHARVVLSAAFGAAKPALLAITFRIVLTVALYAAAPFFAFAFLGHLMEWSRVAVIVLASLGGLVLVAGLVAWLLVWRLLRRAQAAFAEADATLA